MSQMIKNSKGHPVALILYDGMQKHWRINIYDKEGFSTEAEARDFWQANFDHETGEFTGSGKKRNVRAEVVKSA